MSDIGRPPGAPTRDTVAGGRAARTPEGATIAEVGEFPLIDNIVGRLGASRADTVVGAGPDDAAVLRLPDGRLQLATIDSQVASVHFLPDHMAPESVGRKAAAVNLSDIAAMGGRATHALVALAAPADLAAAYALALVDGLAGELARWGADLVGGNLARAETLVLDVALLGEVDESCLLLRTGAHVGDLVLVTGDLGGAAAGAALLAREADRETADIDRRSTAPSRPAAPAQRDRAVARLSAPEPRLSVAPLLAPLGATACIDVSDGLSADAVHLCDRSGVGMRIEAARVPIDEATVAVAAELGRDALDLALTGGEDYELLFTAPPPVAKRLIAEVTKRTGIPVTAIGTVTSQRERVLVLPGGHESPLTGGWRHF